MDWAVVRRWEGVPVRKREKSTSWRWISGGLERDEADVRE